MKTQQRRGFLTRNAIRRIARRRGRTSPIEPTHTTCKDKTMVDGLTAALRDIAESRLTANALEEAPPIQFDFHVQNEAALAVIWPDSDVALVWLKDIMPAETPRWGRNGFVVAQKHVAAIVTSMEDHGLKDYRRALRNASGPLAGDRRMDEEQETQGWAQQNDQDDQFNQ